MTQSIVAQNGQIVINDLSEFISEVMNGCPHDRTGIEHVIESAQLEVFDAESRDLASKSATSLQKIRTDSEKWRKHITDPFVSVQKMLIERTQERLSGVHEAEKKVREKIEAFDKALREKEAAIVEELDKRYKERCLHLREKLGMILDTAQNPALWIIPGTSASLTDAMVRVSSKEALSQTIREKIIPVYLTINQSEEEKKRLIKIRELNERRELIKKGGGELQPSGWWTIGGHGMHDENLLETPVQHITQFVQEAQKALKQKESGQPSSPYEEIIEQNASKDQHDIAALASFIKMIEAAEPMLNELQSNIGAHSKPFIAKQLQSTLHIARKTLFDIKGG